MQQRHVQMIALAGTLGTGLFLGSGKAIAHAGPAGALIAYSLIGSVVYWCVPIISRVALILMLTFPPLPPSPV